MYLGIVLLPLFSAIGGGLFGRFLGSKGTGILSTSCIFLTALLSWKSYLGFLGYCSAGSGSSEGPKWLKVASWIDSDSLLISWGLQIDSVTVTMLVLVTTISTLVHMYSTSYMDGDPHLPKFLSYLSLFTFCMLVLVTGDNLLSLFVGWEGVGLCSYLLINFWSTIIQANKSAIKAMVMNRVGDLGFTLAMLLVYYTFGSIDFSTIAALAPSSQFETTSLSPFADTWGINNFTAIGILFFIGAAGKSAQLGLHTWLPDAMAGPTPVSSLLHSATMVTVCCHDFRRLKSANITIKPETPELNRFRVTMWNLPVGINTYENSKTILFFYLYLMNRDNRQVTPEAKYGGTSETICNIYLYKDRFFKNNDSSKKI